MLGLARGLTVDVVTRYLFARRFGDEETGAIGMVNSFCGRGKGIGI